ncbi:hypothetical protein PVAP13_1NG248719 [Panicum virgatum]|uniref:Uncharacterized protein n=1 Tax=Panicum virgatum TaxID=38727 RepID=A0A8T0WWE2_PANVG|nr:hypothetical protein PVAP13_1NG248719 [Panicum virgatum]
MFWIIHFVLATLEKESLPACSFSTVNTLEVTLPLLFLTCDL